MTKTQNPKERERENGESAKFFLWTRCARASPRATCMCVDVFVNMYVRRILLLFFDAPRRRGEIRYPEVLYVSCFFWRW